MKNIFDEISANEALIIVQQLAKSDNDIKKRIISIAEKIVRNVDLDEISAEVFFDLNCIDVHELWRNAGSGAGDYISPEEMAFEMIEEVLEPFNQEVTRLLDLNMYSEAKFYCMGVLKGIYEFEHESKSEFKDWAADMSGECFNGILDDWKKQCKDDNKAIKEMDTFLNKECSKWA